MSYLLVTRNKPSPSEVKRIDEVVKLKDLPKVEELSVDGYELSIFFNSLNPNYAISRNEKSTLVFSGFGYYKETLIGENIKEIHKEIDEKRLNHKDLRGFYSLILFSEGELILIPDSTGMINFYYNQEKGFFTTSLLVACSFFSNLTISKQELYEYIHFGIIIDKSPFKEISKSLPLNIIHFDNNIVSLVPKKLSFDIPENDISVFNELICAIKEMIQPLKGKTFKTSIGLSAGFDSRTVLCVMDSLGVKPTKISHSYSDQGESEVEIIKELASIVDAPIKFEDTLKKYDASFISRHMFITDGFPFNGSLLRPHIVNEWKERGVNYDIYFKGHGGENLRSYHSFRASSLTMKDLNRLKFFIEEDGIKGFKTKTFLSKLESKLGRFFIEGKIPLHNRERLYGEYFDSLAYVHNDNAQFTYYNLVEPFLDRKVLEIGFKMSDNSKRYANLQRKVIFHFSPRLSTVMSQYKVRFNKEFPLIYKLKKWVRFMTPARLLPILYGIVFKPKKFMSIVDNSETIKLYKNNVSKTFNSEITNLFDLQEVRNTRRLSRILTIDALIHEFSKMQTRIKIDD